MGDEGRKPIRANDPAHAFTPQKPISHVSPRAIVRVLLDSFIRAITGIDAERRDVVGKPQPEYGHPEISHVEQSEIWIDFVADTGDGFDATYTIARLLTEPTLLLGDAPTQRVTHRGRVLVLGGDLVYPVPSRRQYRDRLVGPFLAADPGRADVGPPDVIAIPGTHDWIDGLAAFRTTFTQGGWMGSWRLQQTRSYVDVELPHHYWLWCVDVHLGADVEPQRKYFEDAARRLAPGDRVILCAYHPLWQKVDATDEVQLAFLSGLIADAKAQLILQLSGKRHYYARYKVRPADGKGASHAIICGGGGAFTEDSSLAPVAVRSQLGRRVVDYEQKRLYPDAQQSRLRSVTRLLQLFWTARLLGLVGAFLWLSALAIEHAVPTTPSPLPSWPRHVFDVIATPVPLAVTLLAWIVMTVLARQGRSSAIYVTAAVGLVHACAHAAAAGVVWTIAGDLDAEPWLRVAAAAGMFVLSTLTVLISYLAIALAFRQHRQEIMPSLALAKSKSFVRLHINTKGDLTIHTIAIDDVATDWTSSTTAGPWFVRGAGITPLARELERIRVGTTPAHAAARTRPQAKNALRPHDVFISYSRRDEGWVRAFAARLKADALEDGIDDLLVFVDVESLRTREFWRTRLVEEIAFCRCFVAVLSEAYMEAWETEGVCYAEYEHAMVRQFQEGPLVVDVIADPTTKIRTRFGPPNHPRLPLAAVDTDDFKAVYDQIKKNVTARRAGNRRPSPETTAVEVSSFRGE